MLHKTLAEGRWLQMSLSEQMGNIGSEVGRAARWQNKDEKIFWSAVERAAELFDLTLADKRWRGRLVEIGRVREVFADGVLGGSEYNTSLSDLERYFTPFAMASILKSSKA